jgi:hypothetical protein
MSYGFTAEGAEDRRERRGDEEGGRPRVAYRFVAVPFVPLRPQRTSAISAVRR